MKTYWVEYTYKYTYIDGDTGETELVTDFDAGRFQCHKRDIKKEVIKLLKEDFENDPSVKCTDDFNVVITDCYETTEYEI